MVAVLGLGALEPLNSQPIHIHTLTRNQSQQKYKNRIENGKEIRERDNQTTQWRQQDLSWFRPHKRSYIQPLDPLWNPLRMNETSTQESLSHIHTSAINLGDYKVYLSSSFPLTHCTCTSKWMIVCQTAALCLLFIGIMGGCYKGNKRLHISYYNPHT